MMTLEEVYAKAVSSDEEKKALAQALTSKESTGAYLAERGCDASPEELVALLKEKAGAAGELSDENLEGAAAGSGFDFALSFATLGIACGIMAYESYSDEKNGVKGGGSGMSDLCSTI